MIIRQLRTYLLLLFLYPFFSNGQLTAVHDSIALVLKQNPTDTISLSKLNMLLKKAIAENERVDDATIDAAHKILAKARIAGNDNQLAIALLNLEKCYIKRHDSSKALEYALQAHTVYERTGDRKQLAYVYLQLGVIYYTQNNYSKSFEYYNRSIELSEQIGDRSYIATLYYLSGINYSRMGNFPASITEFRKSLKLKQEIGDQQGITECYVGLAELFLNNDKPDSAIAYIEKAYAFLLKENNIYGQAKANVLKAEALLAKKQYEESRQLAILAQQQAESLDAAVIKIDATKILHRINAETGKYHEAYDYLQQHVALRDSIYNEKTALNMSRLEADHILEKKQGEILLLEKENRNRKLLLQGSFIIGILFLLLAFLFYNRYMLKRKANQKLMAAYSDLEKTQQQLIQQEKLASLGQLTAGIAHEIKNPLNFVNNFTQISSELLSELKEEKTEQGRIEIISNIEFNLDKIFTHGKRANQIVSRMLEHSRSGESDLEPTDINKLCTEYYTLAYQATRIAYPGFNCKVNASLDNTIPTLNLVSQEISRVLLNIFSNCLYATIEKQKNSSNYEPSISYNTYRNGTKVIVKIADNGTGIPAGLSSKIFQPFFTTKPPGKGTGLGLSISYDIIKAHGGDITAANNNEGGAEFVITLPIK
jgi:two-component system, NtrC family, sensor kinase